MNCTRLRCQATAPSGLCQIACVSTNVVDVEMLDPSCALQCVSISHHPAVKVPGQRAKHCISITYQKGVGGGAESPPATPPVALCVQ